MKKNHSYNLKFAFKVLSLVGLGASLLAVFFLTEQTPEDTTQLSSFVAHNLYNLLSFMGITLPLDSLSVLNKVLRRLAHTVEFFVVGFFVASVVLLWAKKRIGCVKSRNVILGICVVLSLFDQTHKLFVVGREFDVLDLFFDAAGYLLALLVVFVINHAIRQRSQQ